MAADPFDRVLGQPRVREFLRAVVASGRIGQAYLFTGPSGSNKTAAAYALAQAIVCERGGCGECDDCRRALRRSHSVSSLTRRMTASQQTELLIAGRLQADGKAVDSLRGEC